MGQQPAFSHLIFSSYLKLRLIMLANELIDRLERLGLLDQEIIEALREQLVQGGTRVTPEAVAKLLVDNGHLTRFQATKLIGELRSGENTSRIQTDRVSLLKKWLILKSLPDEDAEPVEAVVEEVAASYEAENSLYDADVEEVVAVEAVEVGALDEDPAGPETSVRPKPKHKKADSEKSQWDSF